MGQWSQEMAGAGSPEACGCFLLTDTPGIPWVVLPGDPGEPRQLSEEALEGVGPLLALLPSTEVDTSEGILRRQRGRRPLPTKRTQPGSSKSSHLTRLPLCRQGVPCGE